MGLLTESLMGFYLFSNAFKRGSSFGIRNREHGITSRIRSMTAIAVFIKMKDSEEKPEKKTKLTFLKLSKSYPEIALYYI